MTSSIPESSGGPIQQRRGHSALARSARECRRSKHGQRANSIITGMLQHARNSSSSPEVVDINAFVTESLNLAYHGIRAKDAKFKVAVETAYDPAVGQGELIRSDVSRVFINILNNAFYSTRKSSRSWALPMPQ